MIEKGALKWCPFFLLRESGDKIFINEKYSPFLVVPGCFLIGKEPCTGNDDGFIRFNTDLKFFYKRN
jgi:hypothetical protein